MLFTKAHPLTACCRMKCSCRCYFMFACSEGQFWHGVIICRVKIIILCVGLRACVCVCEHVQNLPSVVVGHVLGPRPGERILDMCAAPGGKTTHIAALMSNQVNDSVLSLITKEVSRAVFYNNRHCNPSLNVYCFSFFFYSTLIHTNAALFH